MQGLTKLAYNVISKESKVKHGRQTTCTTSCEVHVVLYAVKGKTLKLTATQERVTDDEPTESEGNSVAGLHSDPCQRPFYDMAPTM